MTELLDRLERYYDTVPRAGARAEEHGPLTLFVREGVGWPFYARPAPDADGGPVSRADVDRVRARQRELGVPSASSGSRRPPQDCARRRRSPASPCTSTL